MLHCGVRALRVCQKWQRCHRLLLVTADRGPRYSIAADVGKRKRTVEVADATPLAAASMDLPVRRSASNLAVMTEASNDDALIATQAISVSTSRRKGAVKVDVLSKDVSEKMLPNARAVKAKKRIPAIKQEDAEVELKAAEEQREGSPGDPFTGNGTGGDEDEPPKEEELKEAAFRPPPVHSDYLPLPWKGRLGYVRYPGHSEHCMSN